MAVDGLQEHQDRELCSMSPRVNMKRARPRHVSRTLYNYVGRDWPFRATPDTPPLAAAMLVWIFASRLDAK